MAKMKLVSTIQFIVCLIGLSVMIVGGFPYWSMAAIAVIQPSSLAISKEPKTILNNVSYQESFRNDHGERETILTMESHPDLAQSVGEPLVSQTSVGEVQSQSSSSSESLAPPIHQYYDEFGNPPTAPGLAMSPRQFLTEKGKTAYLTFDDGPSPNTTPQILAILAQEKVHATFFNVGERVKLNPNLLQAEYEQGNVIGNHTYSHKMDKVYKGPDEFLADVKEAETVIYNTIGIRPLIIRAPGGTIGHFNVDYFNRVDANGYLMEDWNVDAGDADAGLVPKNQLIRNIELQIQGKTRVVILMHDLAGKTTTIQALPEIIKTLRQQGFSFGVLGSNVRPIIFPQGLHKAADK